MSPNARRDDARGSQPGTPSTLLELVRLRARIQPDAPALVDPATGATTTYGSLGRGVEAIRARLAGAGVRRGDRVALMSTGDVAGAIAVFGTASATACVPLDPAEPDEALRETARRLGVRTVVVPAGAAPAVRTRAGSLGLDVVPLDAPDARGAESPGAALEEPGADDIALVLFTSGTTGRAKAVPLLHGSLVGRAFEIAGVLALGEADVAVNAMPLSHSHGLLGTILSMVAAGGRTVCFDRFDAPRFAEAVVSRGATWFSHVPAMHQALVDHARRDPASFAGHRLRFVSTTSAQASVRLVREVEQLLGVPCIDRYATTECTGPVAWEPFDPAERRHGSVGRGAPGTIRILSETGEPLPPNEKGEIAVRDPLVVGGYLDDPEASAASFRDGWYHTGDLGYLDEDGNLFLCGRLRDVVNRGGAKIAPAEVDAILCDHPAVAYAASFGVPHPTLGEDIAAAVVLRPGAKATADQIRRFAAVRLPVFKVPRQLHVVDALPTGHTGKVLRRLLRERFAGAAEATSTEAPATDAERIVAGLFERVLGVENVSRDADFFALGGDSLRAGALAAAAAEQGLHLDFATLADAPTVRELALRLGDAAAGAERVPPVVPRASAERLALSSNQARLWFLERLTPGTPFYNETIVLRLAGPVDVDALRWSLDELCRRHESLRTVYRDEAGVPWQMVMPPLPVPFIVADLRGVPADARDAEREQQVLAEVARPFDLARGPMFRARLVRTTDEEAVLVLMTHHVAIDLAARDVLLDELRALYEARVARGDAGLAAPEVQYGDYAVWQRERLAGERGAGLVEYWREHLAGAPTVLRLPTDFPRPDAPRHRGARLVAHLSAEQTAALRALAVEERSTPFMALLAAFAAMLREESGQRDLVIGTPVDNRPRPEIARTVGFFANTLALRVRARGATFRELLREARRVSIDGVAHQEAPFERVIEALNPERSASHTPLVQVVLSHRAARPAVRVAAGLEMREETISVEHSRFDLALQVEEKADGFECLFFYDTDLFTAATAARWAERFARAVEHAARPDEPISLAVQAPAPEVAPARVAHVPGARALPSPADRADDPVDDASNLTRNQYLMWLGQTLAPESPAYMHGPAVWISGPLDPDAFVRAFRTIVRSADSLRTVIDVVNGVPRQRVLDAPPRDAEIVDLSAEPDPDAAYAAWQRDRLSRPARLDACLYDCALVKLGAERWVWYMMQHHIVYDGWSLRLLRDRLDDLYGRALRGELPETIDLPRYADYVAHERAYRESPRFAEDYAYWRRKLAHETDPVSLYGRPAVPSSPHTARIVLELDAERGRRLLELSRRAGLTTRSADATLSNIFGAVILAFLHRVSGAERLALGVPTHNRRERAHVRTLGLVMQVLPAHVDVSGDDTFRALTLRLAEELERGHEAHGRCAVMNPGGGRGYTVLYNYLSTSDGVAFGHPVDFDLPSNGHAGESLSFTVLNAVKLGRFRVLLDFNAELFDEALREAAAAHFLRVIDACLEDPDRAVDDVDLLSEADLALARAADRTAELPGCADTVADLFERRVAERPDAPALVAAGGTWSYAALDRRAERLARRLQAQGVGPGHIVGLLVDRSPQLAVAILGVLKSGAAYLPLDAAWPVGRLTAILADARASVVLADVLRRETALQAAAGRAVWTLDGAEQDRDAASLAHGEASAARRRAMGHDAASLAYVIYTSGSSGEPKGVAVEHRAVASYVRAAREVYGISADDRVLHTHAATFDLAVEELLLPWTNGACSVFAPAGPPPAPERELTAFLRAQRVTVVSIATAYWHAWVGAMAEERAALPESLRLVTTGGEAASAPRLAEWQQLAGAERVRWTNSYGPTEATVCCVSYEPEPGARWDVRRAVPIGRPWPGTAALVLDRRGRPCPAGVPGELWLAGAQLARGYLGRPDLTAERFVDAAGDGRRYRTGDRARRAPGGALEFLGRADRQVKLRGYRVEPAEVEAALRRHPAVADAAVLVQDGPSGQALRAYVVRSSSHDVDEAALQAHARASLPAYMVPASVTVVDSFPLTAHGKVDLRELARVGERLAAARDVAGDEPRTPLEEQIAGVWRELLGIERVGVHDNFFALGGHSLLATRAAARLQQAVGIEVPLHVLFEAPTISGLAIAMTAHLAGESNADDLDEIFAALDAMQEGAQAGGGAS